MGNRKKSLKRQTNELINDLTDAKGFNRDLIEVRNTKANTKLATETLKKLKSEFWHNILFVIIGAFIGFIPNILNKNKMKEEVILMNKLLIVKEKQYEYFQIEVRQMRSELFLLKNELDSLKIDKGN